MAIRFLFWNLKELPLEKLVAACAAEHAVDVIVLTECKIEPNALIEELSEIGLRDFSYPPSPAGETGDIRVFIRGPKARLHYVFDDVNNHVAIRRLSIDGLTSFLLVAVHSQSKRSWSDDDQAMGVIRLARRIAEVEEDYEGSFQTETILVGDFNMNPFEKGMIGSEGLHGVMTARIARDSGRIVDGEFRKFFYNPMWRFFGERADGPPGTYYFPAGGKPIAYYWHMFDQVLVRPALADRLDEVRILHAVRGLSLLNAEGVPDVKVGSDHLPLLSSIRS